MQLVAGEPVADLEGRGVFGVGAVNGVLRDGGGKLLADGSLFGVGRIGGAHQLAQVGDGVVFLKNHEDQRARGHESGELVEEGPLAMDGVEALGLAFGDGLLLDGNDAKAGLVDLGENGAGVVPAGPRPA